MKFVRYVFIRLFAMLVLTSSFQVTNFQTRGPTIGIPKITSTSQIALRLCVPLPSWTPLPHTWIHSRFRVDLLLLPNSILSSLISETRWAGPYCTTTLNQGKPHFAYPILLRPCASRFEYCAHFVQSLHRSCTRPSCLSLRPLRSPRSTSPLDPV